MLFRSDRSIIAARGRGYRGRVDLEVMGGRRGQDLFLGATSSAAAGAIGLHVETAAFRLPDPLPDSASMLVWKAVSGVSYRIPLGGGVITFVEYHYSQFGARRPEQIISRLATPAFAARYLRADTQILGRHALAVTGSYELSPAFAASALWLLSPVDASGIVSPSLTMTLEDRKSTRLNSSH